MCGNQANVANYHLLTKYHQTSAVFEWSGVGGGRHEVSVGW